MWLISLVVVAGITALIIFIVLRGNPAKSSNEPVKKPLDSEIFPYTMDDMMDMPLSPFLRYPNIIAITPNAEQTETLVGHLLDELSNKIPFAKVYLLDVFGGQFIMNRLHPIAQYFRGEAECRDTISAIHNEVKHRQSCLRSEHSGFYSMYKATPIYVFLDGINTLQHKKYEDMFSNVVDAIVCARQINIHVIVFEGLGTYSETRCSGWFAADAVLAGAVCKKTYGLIPYEYRGLLPSQYYFHGAGPNEEHMVVDI